jgi:hypothetical protein
MPKSHVQEVEETLELLEVEGLVRRNGEFRRAPNGLLQPVYDLTPLGRRLCESGQLDKYFSTSLDGPVS